MTKKQQSKKKPTKKKEVSLMLRPGALNQTQLRLMLGETPTEHIYRRPAKGGGQWEYVTGVYIKKVLNYVFGWMWDFEVKEHGREGNLVWVLGKLTIKDKVGKPMITKEQFGRADIKFKRGTKDMVDFGNDLKAASTDALKKCASELGIASDIYGANEFKLIQKEDKGYIPPQVQEDKKPILAKAEPANGKLEELKKMLKGNTDNQKLVDLKKRAEIILPSFRISQKHASILIAELLKTEVSKKK